MMAKSAGEAGVRGQGEAEVAESTTRDAAWIFWTDVRRTWVSFPVAAVVASVLGLYAGGFLLSENATVGSGSGLLGPLGGFWFLAVVPVLNVNFLFNCDYYYRLSGDNLARRLAFLRELPISAAALVAGRIAYMLLALVVSAPAFFATTYRASELIRNRLDPVEYLCFVAIWCGYALFAGGLYLFLWHAVTWKTQLRAIPTLMVLYLILAVLFDIAFGMGLLVWTVEVVEARGVLAAAVALAVGAGGLAAWAAAATRRLERRDLSS